ncbi:DUF411 domain-containing protein [Methylocystis heyeri]|uniref:DUF411 domain-containing protein n=1 Tax=Methylocystis heyeri TaxID=391905 RepID=A0A6B8KGG5_9HYPH|nr:DUF411 domain-containing protein [Methylocystis heyeri]QGM47436.1 DUF411 domain-containing protein [Methylocystis heyeri]
MTIKRRDFFIGAASAALAAVCAAPATAEPAIRVLVHRDATCGCCGRWAAKLKDAGFAVEVVDEPDMKAVKARLGVPAGLTSCHTAEIEGYVVEGHTPVAAIQRLLQEKPKAAGLATPGMPSGSPGMEMGGEAEPYEVYLFGPQGQSSYGGFKGGSAI